MECLHGEFDAEPGNGGDRCDYLRERGIETYLVVVPKGPVGKNGINGVVSQPCHTPTLQIFGYSNVGVSYSASEMLHLTSHLKTFLLVRARLSMKA